MVEGPLCLLPNNEWELFRATSNLFTINWFPSSSCSLDGARTRTQEVEDYRSTRRTDKLLVEEVFKRTHVNNLASTAPEQGNNTRNMQQGRKH